MPSDDTIREQALDWAVRAGDPAFEDWEALTLWLEQDPAHARAYDEVCAAVATAAELVSAAAPANDDTIEDDLNTRDARSVTRRRWFGGALATSVALVLGLTLWQDGGRNVYSVETTAGQMKAITLDKGSRIDLAGATRIELDRDDPRYAKLEQGQALFTIRHDESDPFRLIVGEDRLIDVGTVFDVRRDGANMSVAVSEGAVQFNPDRENVRISQGESLRKRGDGYVVKAIAPAQVGEWREGRLTFSDAPLDEVAADLTRASGMDFVAAPNGQAHSISGSLLIAPLREDPRTLGPLLGLTVRAEGDHWIIGAP